jgi:hypothetical protein
VEKFASQSSQAVWFAELINANKKSLDEFWADSNFLAGTRGTSGHKHEIQIIQKEVQKTIQWALDPKSHTETFHSSKTIASLSGATGKVISGSKTALTIVPQYVTLARVGHDIQLMHLAPDFVSAVLSYLFPLLCASRRGEMKWFGQCRTCHRIFARRGWGRQFYCREECQWRSRTPAERNDYFKKHQQRRRADMKRLQNEHPEIAEMIRMGGLTLAKARKEIRARRLQHKMSLR